MHAREQKIYKGITFRLWKAQRTWFWIMADLGVIGAASSHGLAVREACSAIEQILGSASALERTDRFEDSHVDWHNILDRLAEYVAAA